MFHHLQGYNLLVGILSQHPPSLLQLFSVKSSETAALLALKQVTWRLFRCKLKFLLLDFLAVLVSV